MGCFEDFNLSKRVYLQLQEGTVPFLGEDRGRGLAKRGPDPARLCCGAAVMLETRLTVSKP